MNDSSKPYYVKASEVKKHYNVTSETLRRWSDDGKIGYKRTPGNTRLYDVNSFVNGNEHTNTETESFERIRICYSRVSTRGQSDDLQRDRQFMQERFPTHEIVQDISSGFNFDRRGLRYILDRAFEGRLEEVVVSDRDRLSRIAFPLLQYIFDKLHVKLVVLEKDLSIPESDLVSDLISLVHSFSAKMHGRRSHNRKHDGTNDIPKSEEGQQGNHAHLASFDEINEQAKANIS